MKQKRIIVSLTRISHDFSCKAKPLGNYHKSIELTSKLYSSDIENIMECRYTRKRFLEDTC